MYFLILYFTALLFYNLGFKDYDETEDGELKLIIDTYGPLIGIALSAIVGIIIQASL